MQVHHLEEVYIPDPRSLEDRCGAVVLCYEDRPGIYVLFKLVVRFLFGGLRSPWHCLAETVTNIGAGSLDFHGRSRVDSTTPACGRVMFVPSLFIMRIIPG